MCGAHSATDSQRSFYITCVCKAVTVCKLHRCGKMIMPARDIRERTCVQRCLEVAGAVSISAAALRVSHRHWLLLALRPNDARVQSALYSDAGPSPEISYA